MRRYLIPAFALVFASVLPICSNANATLVTLDASADIYNAAGPSVYEGTSPYSISTSGVTSFTFSVPAGSKVTLNSGRNLNDADGVGSENSSSFNTGANGISGLTAPNDGFLTGVFIGPNPGSTQPAALNFSTLGTNFASLSPLLQQTFFIGDGLTGDGTGTTQTFYVPVGATALYLGISDACNYNGPPSCYNDNSGSFVNLEVTPVASVTSAVPETATWAMMIIGIGGIGGMMRRAHRKSEERFTRKMRSVATA